MAIRGNGTGYLELPAKVAPAYPFSIMGWFSQNANANATWVGQYQSDKQNGVSIYHPGFTVSMHAVATYSTDGVNGLSAFARRDGNPEPSAVMRLAVAVFTGPDSRTIYFADNVPYIDTVAIPDQIAVQNRFTIGAAHYTGNAGSAPANILNGSFAEVHVFGVALTAADVANLLANTVKPEAVPGWIDGWMLRNASDLTSISGTRTLTAFGDISDAGAAAHPFARPAAAAVVPGAPVIGVATVGNASASVPFAAPGTDGGSPITGYIATSSLGETKTGTVSPIVFTGLSAVARTFHVQAINTVGTGPASAESNSVTPTVNNPPSFSGAIANIDGTGGTAIAPVDVHALYSDTDAITFSASPAGTAWPSGLVVHPTTGVISGTAATSTNAGLKVRATDTAGQTADSNAFTVTLVAPASTVTGVTVTPATLNAAGGSTGTLTAAVAGEGGPSQAVNWSISAGTINNVGTYTLPAATNAVQTVTATATSAQDGTKSGTCVITVPALALLNWTPVCVLKAAADGAPAANVAIHAFIHDLVTGALLGTKTGLVTSAAGLPPAFTTNYGLAGTAYDVKFVDDANNLRRSLERIVPV